MPSLLLRDNSSASLTALVESARKRIYPLQVIDLRLNNCELEFISLRPPNRKINSTSTDEGFESDIDTSSIISLDNDSFNIEKETKSDSKPNENDSANGSDSEAPESGNFEKIQDEVDNSVPACSQRNSEKFNLVDCMCYTDIKCNDILIFVIKKETFVFKFDDINDLRKFYSKFTTLKAVANQRNYESKIEQNLSFPQNTAKVDVINFPFKKKHDDPFKVRNDSKFMSLSDPLDVGRDYSKQKESMSDIKYNTLGSSVCSATNFYNKSSSVVDSLSLDVKKPNLVKESNLKIWNSAEDILDSPKRPQRKKKRRAPDPPVIINDKQDIMSGQYVRVNVNTDSLEYLDNNRIIGKSSTNYVPKKNFSSMFTTKSPIMTLLKPKEKEILKYEHNIGDNMLNRNAKTLSRSWNSSKYVGIPKTKQEHQQFIPLDYRHVDLSKTRHHSTFHSLQKGFVRTVYPDVSQNVAITTKNYVKGEVPAQNINGRLFGLSSKLKDYSGSEGVKKGLWGSHSKKEMTLKSVIKGNKEEVSKKKNDKKVTFSTYTTVQVV